MGATGAIVPLFDGDEACEVTPMLNPIRSPAAFSSPTRNDLDIHEIHRGFAKLVCDAELTRTFAPRGGLAGLRLAANVSTWGRNSS